MRRVIAACSAALVVVLSGCAAQPSVPSLEAVREERSFTMTAAWLRAASATEAVIQRDWPEAAYPPLAFERWVDEESARAELTSCMDRLLGRRSGSLSSTGLVVLAPRPAKEPTWALPVAQLRCSVQLVPWRGTYPFGGPIEQAWVRHQVTVALPNCVRRFGGELVVADVDAAVDASIYTTSFGAPSTGGDAVPSQSVWRAAEVRYVDAATARQIRALCLDPGRALVQLGPADIKPIEFGPSGGSRAGVDGAEVLP